MPLPGQRTHGGAGEHLHFIVEADDNRALSEGMQGLSVRLAKGLNRLMGRHGKVFADRFHAHVLRTPVRLTDTRAGQGPRPGSSPTRSPGWFAAALAHSTGGGLRSLNGR